MLWAPYKRVNRNTISEPSINLASKFCDAKSPWDSVINVEIHLRTRIPGTVWTDYRRARVCPPRVWSIFDLTNALQIRETRSRLDLASDYSRSLVEVSSFRLLLRLVPGGVPAHSGYAARPVRSPEGAGACTLRLRRPTSFARGRSPRLWYGRALPCAGVQALPERVVSKKF